MTTKTFEEELREIEYALSTRSYDLEYHNCLAAKKHGFLLGRELTLAEVEARIAKRLGSILDDESVEEHLRKQDDETCYVCEGSCVIETLSNVLHEVFALKSGGKNV